MQEYNILLFKIKDEFFGADAEEIDEIMEYENNDIGNETILLTYLGDVLGTEVTANSTDSKKVIVTGDNGEYRGFIVDEVIQLLRVPESSIHDAPEILLTEQNKYIDKFCITDKQLFPMINLSKLGVHIKSGEK
ncbi:MAG: hypothetical protein GYA02_13575 [Clostridiaceae bacterium]|jgi:chemotaxis signal transduction protein|nr:hypothetical protein [Clostridiaceae bacterium]